MRYKLSTIEFIHLETLVNSSKAIQLPSIVTSTLSGVSIYSEVAAGFLVPDTAGQITRLPNQTRSFVFAIAALETKEGMGMGHFFSLTA